MGLVPLKETTRSSPVPSLPLRVVTVRRMSVHQEEDFHLNSTIPAPWNPMGSLPKDAMLCPFLQTLI